ncbi:MAG: PAS domain S-box protein [Chloroflexi bacterium]|nr:PAS domain S-box protein [Chloroflexota bacterium]
MKLATRLTIVFLLLALVPIAVVGYLAYHSGRQALQQAAIDHLLSVNLLKSQELDRWIESEKRSLEELAQRPLVRQYTALLAAHDPAHPTAPAAHRSLVADHLQPRLRYSSSLELSIICPRHGIILVSTDERQEGKYRDAQPYFLEGRSQTYLQGVYWSTTLEQPAMTIGTPIRDEQGNLLGVLAGRLDLHELSRIMELQSGTSETEDTYLVNTFNFFVTEPRFGQGYALKKAVHTAGVQAGLAGQDGVDFYMDYRGVPVIGAYRWLPAYQVCLLTEVDQAQAYAPSIHLAWLVTGLASLTGLAVAQLALSFARTLTWPLQELVAGAEEIGRGNLQHRVGTEAKDEIGELSRAFDRMTQELATMTVSRDELTRSEERYRRTLDNLLEGCQILSADWRYLYVNDAGARHGKRPKEELLGRTMMEMYPGIEHTAMFVELQRCLAQRTSHRMENEFTFPDGSKGQFDLYIQPVPEGVAVFSWDISEREQAAKALAESEARYRLLFESAPDTVVVLDTQGTIVECNPGTVFEYPREKLIGRRLTDLLDPQAVSPILRELASAAASEEIASGETRVTRSDGRAVDLWWKGVALRNASGEITGVLLHGRGITGHNQALAAAEQSRRALLSVVEDQRAIEERLHETNRLLSALNRAGLALAEALELPAAYRTAQEHVSQLVDCPCFGISRYDPATQTLHAAYMFSDGAELDTARFPPLTFAEGQPLKGRARALFTQQPEIVTDMPTAPSDQVVIVGAHDETPTARSALYVPIVVRGQSIGLLEVQSYRERAYGEADIALLGPVANQLGLAMENARLFAELQAERDSLAQRVEERTAQLQAANQELEAFAYSVSHDLRAPLRAMDGFSEALLAQYQGQLDEQGQHYLQRIQKASRRMGQLINDLLSLSRVTRYELSRQQVDLSKMAREIAADLQAQEPARQAEFAIAGDMAVEGDAHLLRIAL